MVDLSNDAYIVRTVMCEEAAIVRAALTAPHVLYKPTLKPDGTEWCALLGENLQEGVSGHGDTPAAAMADFDRAWNNDRTPAVCVAAKEVEESDMVHASDCALHNGPAYEPGPCDCGATTPVHGGLEVAVVRRSGMDGDWGVEAIDVSDDGDGECYLTLFSGPDAGQRAAEYAEMKYGWGRP